MMRGTIRVATTLAVIILWLVAGLREIGSATDSVFRCSPQQVFEEIRVGQPVYVDRIDSIPVRVLSAFGFEPGSIDDPTGVWDKDKDYVRPHPLRPAHLLFAAKTTHVWLLSFKQSGGILTSWALDLLCTDNDDTEHVYERVLTFDMEEAFSSITDVQKRLSLHAINERPVREPPR